jgi:hypothetical protein
MREQREAEGEDDGVDEHGVRPVGKEGCSETAKNCTTDEYCSM